MIRAAIVAPIPALRLGLRALLSAAPLQFSAEAEIAVVFEAASLADLAAHSPTLDVLVWMIDPGGEAPVTARGLRRQVQLFLEALPETENRPALLLLAGDPALVSSLAGLPLRAWGLLPVDAGPGELAAAIRGLHEGLLVSFPALLEPALAHRAGWQGRETPLAALAEDESPLSAALTERESQVLQWLGRGLANKQIAAQLGISEHTVKFHISSIYTKLGVANRAEVVRVGVQRGLISL